jgi:hypothetical protein
MELWNDGIVGSQRKLSILNFMFVPPSADHLSTIAVFSSSRRLYPPAWKPYGLEAGPEVKTHFSNIPAFHHSNWGEAPNLIAVK